MHEMSYVVRFVNQALEVVGGSASGQVKRVTVSVGEMTDVLPEYLYKYYPLAVKETVLEGSELEVIEVPARVLCEGCQKEYHPSGENKYLCPNCGDSRGKIIAGRDVVLERVEVEVED